MVALITAGILLARGVDARWLVAAGLIVMATSNYWMSRLNLTCANWVEKEVVSL